MSGAIQFRPSRRGFLTGAALTGATLAGAASGVSAARLAPTPRPTHVEPDMADATSNAPSYWAHPRRAARAATPPEDPLEIALRG